LSGRIVYLHGFASGPQSKKARYFRERLAGRGVDLAIPALDEGDFESLTITRQLEVVARAGAGRAVTLIGSSLGGYLAALYAARHADVDRVVLMAPAFDFAARWSARLGEAAMASWRSSGSLPVYHYAAGAERRVGYGLYEDALGYEAYPRVTQPALVIHGLRDDVAPASLSEEFCRRTGARLVLFDSGHELTDALDGLWRETAAFLGLPGA
jgi:pimeloyl-ACP methyl ester carboxylesterase